MSVWGDRDSSLVPAPHRGRAGPQEEGTPPSLKTRVDPWGPMIHCVLGAHLDSIHEATRIRKRFIGLKSERRDPECSPCWAHAAWPQSEGDTSIWRQLRLLTPPVFKNKHFQSILQPK